MDRRFLWGALAVSLALQPSVALAQQFVIFDQTYTHTGELPDSHYRVDPLPETPADLTSPVDYASGTVHLYMEVLTKPTDEPTKMQVCFEASPTYGCTAQSPTYTTTGLYEWSTDVVDFWSPGTPDWSMGSGRIAVILKDTMNNKPSIDNVGADVAARYTPTDLHLVITWVAPGATYVPPMPDAVDGGVSDGGAADGGAADAGAADAGAADAGPTPDAGAMADAMAAPDATADATPARDDVTGGCSVGGRGAGDAAWLSLFLFVALGARSRRRR